MIIIVTLTNIFLHIFDLHSNRVPQMLIPPNTDRGAAENLGNNLTASDSNSEM
jgi:hypothetical protein